MALPEQEALGCKNFALIRSDSVDVGCVGAHGGLGSRGGSLCLGKVVAESWGCGTVWVGLPKGLSPGCCDLSRRQMVGTSSCGRPRARSPSGEQNELPRDPWLVGGGAGGGLSGPGVTSSLLRHSPPSALAQYGSLMVTPWVVSAVWYPGGFPVDRMLWEPRSSLPARSGLT